MEPIAWQVVLRLTGNRVIARGVPERRLLARAVLERGEDKGLILFAAPDTHLHLVTEADRAVAGTLAKGAARSVRATLDLPLEFEPARFTPIATQQHLHNCVGYVLGNGPRHGNLTDPRCEATNLPDLLGLRLPGRYTGYRLKRLLPRLTRVDLLTHLPVEELVLGRDTRYLADAAAAALSLPDLQGRSTATRQARIAAVHVADQLDLLTAHTAELLGTSDRSIRRYRRLSAPPLLVRAIQLQLGLMEDTGGSGSGPSRVFHERAAL